MLQYDVRFIKIYRDRLNLCIIKIGDLQNEKNNDTHRFVLSIHISRLYYK